MVPVHEITPMNEPPDFPIKITITYQDFFLELNSYMNNDIAIACKISVQMQSHVTG